MLFRVGGGGGGGTGVNELRSGTFGGNEGVPMGSRLGGGGGTGPLGGGAGLRSPVKAGGTLKPAGRSSSSTGDLGGLGGGAGPGFVTPDEALGRLLSRPEGCIAYPCWTASLPAPAKGGGTRNAGLGGEGVLAGGLSSRGGGDSDRPPTGLRDGGGAGGGPRLLEDVVVPVLSGVSLGAGGGGGPGRLAAWDIAAGKAEATSSACFCLTYCLMKSAFDSIWSSVIPICNSSSRIGRHVGSARSIPLLFGLVEGGLYNDCPTCGAGTFCGGAGAELCRCPRRKPPILL